MRTTTTATLLGLSLLLFGCEARTTTPESAGGEAGAAAAEPTLQTQEEIDAYWEKEISDENYDEELDKLMEEITADEAAGDS
jgi:hypothetical protein